MAVGSIAFNSDLPWVDVCTAPETADNSGNPVTNPGGITRSAQNWLRLDRHGRHVQVRLKFPSGGTITTECQVQAFGRDTNSSPWQLHNNVPLGGNATVNVTDGTYSYSTPIDVDSQNALEVLFAVRTALAGTSLTGATIQARIL